MHGSAGGGGGGGGDGDGDGDGDGVASTVKKPAADVAEPAVPAVAMVTETCLAPGNVTVPIVILNVLSSTSEQVAVMPLTVALHEAAVSCAVVMKLVPVTVMVLPA